MASKLKDESHVLSKVGLLALQHSLPNARKRHAASPA
jgi:hypothetical protein